MDASGADKQGKSLAWALGALCVVIVGLVAAIVVVKINDNKNSSSVADCFQDGVDARECMDEKAESYIEYDDEEEEIVGGCEEALKVYEEMPTDKIDEQTLASLYNEASSFSIRCGDEVAQEYWYSKYREINDRIGGRS